MLNEEGWALTQHLNRRTQANASMITGAVSAPEMAVSSSVSNRVMANHASLVQSNIREGLNSVHLKYGGRREEERRGFRRWSECRCVRESCRGPVEGPGSDS